MGYIYEMDVALLRMQYLLPEHHFIFDITTSLINCTPYDRSNMEMEYTCSVCCINEKKEFDVIKLLKGDSIQDLVNQCRIWAILQRNEHPVVN